MNTALIIAGGSGQRMKQDIPKQFLNVYDKPVIIYTLEAFEKHPDIDSIAVVCLEGWEEILRAYSKQFNITKLKWIVKGGENGQQSIKNGLDILKQHIDEDNIILIHDGNRALVSLDIISDSIVTCRKYGNAVTAIPCTEVILKSTNNIASKEAIPREELMRTQTPQVFKLSELILAHEEAGKRGINNSLATCSLMVELGKEVYFSSGSEKNIKITRTEDIEIFKSILISTKDTWLK
ncbi:IspD/TarI family cytidylyltransferase [Paenibacillus tepidiphilus]|uniref:IspD/TarI family cytidylyltransferase n=1 Tax=Paenibacillus tepidiphilus TaxID=2608683 RepID=UPI00123A262F|nr:IspD/TarI family cytidylyltransferase [Paenibacillus tepidiphilus]